MSSNIYPLPRADDADYKQYYSQFKIAAKKVLPGTESEAIFVDWMKLVVRRFPYFVHTNANVMAVASLFTSEEVLPILQVRDNLGTLFRDLSRDELRLLSLDVARYWKRLRG